MYRFEIERFDGQAQWDRLIVHPIYGEDTELSIEREQGERYCRYNINGEFTFVKDDFVMLWDDDNSHYGYRFNIYHKDEGGETLIASAPFYFEDLDYDWDNQIATLKLKGKDQYEDFLEKMDGEYDLVQLAPPKSPITLTKRAFLQLYVLGDTKLTNIVGNMEYETNTTNGAETKNPGEIEGMGFKRVKVYSVVEIQTPSSWNVASCNGVYVGDRTSGRLNKVGDSTIWLEPMIGFNWGLRRSTGTAPSGERGWNYIAFRYKDTLSFSESLEVEWSESGQQEFGGKAVGNNRDIYLRLITDKFVDDTDNITTKINPSTDIWERNLNYDYYIRGKEPNKGVEAVLGALGNNVILSRETSEYPNKWQQDDHGMYFIPPQPTLPTERMIAVGWSQWIPMSIWFKNSVDVSRSFFPYDAEWELKDAYTIKDSIEALLKKIDKDMTFRSDFLDGVMDTAVSEFPFNPISKDYFFKLFITPITNIKKTQYEQAAQKGKISLKQIVDMMRQCFNCYWFLEWDMDHWQMRMEHSEWFRNGGVYKVNPLDLPAPPYRDLVNEKSRLSCNPWITDQNKMTYKLDEVKSRYEFEWGDKCAELFNGYPINVKDGYAKGKPVEKVQVANFTADIDLIQSSPEVLSDDIFVVIGASSYDEGMTFTPIMEEVGFYGLHYNQYPTYLPQNSSLTFYSLEQTFLYYEKPGLMELELEDRYDVYGHKIEVSVPFDNHGIPQRIIGQSVVVPFTVEKNDICYEKIETGDKITLKQGLGQIERLSVNLYTNQADMDLLFEPNIDY